MKNQDVLHIAIVKKLKYTRLSKNGGSDGI